MSAVAFASLEWRTALMPGSNAPSQLALLPRAADGAFRAFVRFPAGWSRPGAGHYPVPEEFFILEGDLRLNDTTWREGGYAWVPANRVRSASRSESGCLAFAWFASAPRWIPGEPTGAALSDDVIVAHWRDAPEHAISADGSGRRLYAGAEHHTWIVQRRQIAQLATHGMRCDSLGLRDRAWRCDAEHDPPDDTTEAVLVRIWQES
jgi:hypothetical protein